MEEERAGTCVAGALLSARVTGILGIPRCAVGTMEHPFTISVVVCTHNRARLLGQALESLATQTLSPESYEIVVVNNRSTDDTPAVVERAQGRWNAITIRLIDEPMLGLGYARNRGWACARGRYVGFIDDDAKADPRWLERALALFENDNAPVAVGGKILPYYPTPKPPWYKDEYEVRSWGSVQRLLTPGEAFSGCNMLFQKVVLQELGGFDVRVGMRGEQISMGEETVLFQKLWAVLGDHARVLYSPELGVYHAVGKRRMTASYHLSRWFVAGQVAGRLEEPASLRERLSRLRMNWTAIRRMTWAALQERARFADRRVWAVERLGPIALEVGRFLARVGLYLSVRREKSAGYVGEA